MESSQRGAVDHKCCPQPAQFSLTVRTEGAEFILTSPASSPTRAASQQHHSPLRPSLQPSKAARRVSWAQQEEVRRYSAGEQEEPGSPAGVEQAPPPLAGSPGWHSPPPAPPRAGAQPHSQPDRSSYAAPQPAYGTGYAPQAPAAAPAVQQLWEQAYAAGLAPGMQQCAQAFPQQQYAPQQQPQQQQHYAPQQQQPESQQQQQPGTQWDPAPAEPRSEEPARHMYMYADSVTITFSSPDVKLRGLPAAPCAAAPPGAQQASASTPAIAVPAAVMARAATQTDAAADQTSGGVQSVQAAPALPSEPAQPSQGIPAAPRPVSQPPQQQPVAPPPSADPPLNTGMQSSGCGGRSCCCNARAAAPTYTGAARTIRLSPQRGRVSAADALPARLAAQQLGSLVELSCQQIRLLQQQAGVVEQAVLARAFYAWRHLLASQQQRRQAALAACRLIDMGRLRRCLHSWRSLGGAHERQRAVLRRAAAQLRRGLLQRCWDGWRRVCGLRWWKVQLEARDQQLQLLGAQASEGLQLLRHLESRPVRYMRRYRLRALLAAWQREVEYQRVMRAVAAAAVQHARRSALAAALGGWQAVAAERAARQQALQRARRLLGRLHVRQAVGAWRGAVAAEAAWRERVAAAKRLRRQQLLRKALSGWRYQAWFQRAGRDACSRRQLAMAAAALGAWRRQAALAAARTALLAAADRARAGRLAARAFGAWHAGVEGLRARRQAEQLGRLEAQLAQLAAENGQLKAEHERLCRVIDSGDWGRQRVEELVAAGAVLREERAALLSAVEGLRRGVVAPERQPPAAPAELQLAALPPPPCLPLRDASNSPQAAALAAGGQAQQLRTSVTGGLAAGLIPACRPGSSASAAPTPGSPAAVPSAAARNKLLVRTGSSFNALVRALKQDLVAGGALGRAGAATVYELSLHRLSIAVDGGELEVQAVGSPDRQGVAFGCTFPLSPKRKQPLAVTAEDALGAGAATSRGARHAPDPARESSGLLAAALRLQGIGGRSVGLRGSRG